MSFGEIVNSMNDDSRLCDLELRKCSIYAEASFNEYMINCSESDLKVMKESGTIDDLTYLYEEAQEGFIERAKKAIKKTITAVIEFIKKIARKIKETFGGKAANDALDKVEEACKKNPKLKGAKVEVPDVEKEQKFYQKILDKIKGISAKAKGGHSSDKVSEELDEAVESAHKARKAAIAGATITVGIGAAVVILRKLIKKASNENNEDVQLCLDTEKRCSGFLEVNYRQDIHNGTQKNTPVPGTDLAVIAQKVATSTASVTKVKTDSLMSSITSFFPKLKGSVTAGFDKIAKKTTKEKEVKTESAFDSDSYLDDLLTESGITDDDTDIDDTFSALLESVQDTEDDSFDSLFDSLDSLAYL